MSIGVSSMRADAPVGAWPAWPAYALQHDLLPLLSEWADDGHAMALATLMEIRGRSPRPLGSEMAIRDDGEVAGYVSGGCVEAAVAHEAMAVLADGRARWLSYGEGSDVLDIQLGCGGGIGILVRRLDDLDALLARWRIARHRRVPLHLAIDRRSGAQRILDSADDGVADTEFRQWHLPPPRLALVGGDPCMLAALEIAPRMGMEVRLLRPHGPERAPPGLAQAHYDRRALATALRDLELDARTALYSLTHDMDIDLAVAHRGLSSTAACVGVLGSRTKRGLLVDQLQALGHGGPAVARLRMPIGLPLLPPSPHGIAFGMVCEALQAMPLPTSATSVQHAAG